VSEHEVRFERLVDATVEEAFQAWNDADARVRWHKAEDHWTVEASTDLRVGGGWRVACGPSADEPYVEDGVFEVVDPPHRVVYTCAHRVPGRPIFQTRITVTFEARGDQTLVAVGSSAGTASECPVRNSSNNGTVNAVSPCTGLWILPLAIKPDRRGATDSTPTPR
jgi:uncharacterized protein YndB with AHSA1/START domain